PALASPVASATTLEPADTGDDRAIMKTARVNENEANLSHPSSPWMRVLIRILAPPIGHRPAGERLVLRAKQPATRYSVFCPDLAWIQDPLGIHDVLDALHHVERVAMLGPHVRRAYRAGPVLASHGPADLDRELVQAVGELVGAADLVGVLGIDEDRGVHVPVAEVPGEDRR